MDKLSQMNRDEWLTYAIETPPSQVASLAELTPEAAELYEPNPKGKGFKLKRQAREAINETNARLKQLWSEHCDKCDSIDRKLDQQDQIIEKLAKKITISNAVAEAGVPGPLQQAAVALLSESLELVVEPQGEGKPMVLANTPFGRVEVSQAVGEFLASSEGEAFMPAKPTHDGPYASRLKRLLKVLH